jgi:O-antigen ligase
VNKENILSIEPASSNKVWSLLYFEWLIVLIRPEWLISSHIPSLIPLRILPTVLLLFLFIVWIKNRSLKYNFKWVGIFFIVVCISALSAENTGRARWALRFFIEIYILGKITFSFIDEKEKIRSLFGLYLVHFSFLAVWGIIGHGIIYWDYILNEEDAFGPLMCIGFGFSSYYYESLEKGLEKKIAFATICLCLVGVIASFARGSFVTLVIVLLYKLVVSKNILKNILLTTFSAIVVIIAASILFPPSQDSDKNLFWEEMATISEGTTEGTGRDRRVLWTIAWEEFKDNPVFGVGPNNFGIQAPKYVLRVDDAGQYIDPAMLWGRALHNGFLQILSELGMIGTFVFIMLIIDFIRTNGIIKRISMNSELLSSMNDNYENYGYISKGLKLSFIAFMLSAFFYDIIFYTWFWYLIILNRMLFVYLSNQEIIFNKKALVQ